MMQSKSDYIKNAYGVELDWYETRAKFAPAENYFVDHHFDGLFAEKREVEVQCDKKPIAIDKENLPFERKMALYLKEFCFSTSAHGLPMIGQSRSTIQKCIWSVLFLASFSMYWYQILQVMEKYNRNDKNVNIKLIFESPLFPAITLCNLNPYRKSAVAEVSLVAKTMKAFDDVMKSVAEPPPAAFRSWRMKRSNVPFEAARSVCRQCTDDGKNCEASKEKKPVVGEDYLCICAFDRHAGDAWPCYLEEKWTSLRQCYSCNAQGMCNEDKDSAMGDLESSCLCQSIDQFCIAHESHTNLLNLWEYYGGGIPTEDPGFLEALGFSGMTDEVAIVTKAKENIVFAMATLSMEERRKLSHSKMKFLQKCSFNGAQCDIHSDFNTHIDPIFGNCFTFNFNRTDDLTSARAGPMYGLRMIVFVNTTEYLPTTEAAGVKLTIHEKSEFPFPDIFGYNAPVGYISSFGIKYKRMSRLSKPYGECLRGAPPSSFIYDTFDYSTEGCLRSCFQQLVLHDCGCGDPRFPIIDGYQHCSATDPVARRCLEAMTKGAGEDSSGRAGNYKCTCKQPCESSQYAVTYSASQWPSQSLKVQLGLCKGSQIECAQYYRDNAAMIEVFYDQLNYEFMEETPAYGIVNLFADFGGQLGLWLGVSVITCCEFVYLVLKVGTMVAKHQYNQYKQKKLSKQGGLPSAQTKN